MDNGKSIGFTVSDAIVRSWLWSTTSIGVADWATSVALLRVYFIIDPTISKEKGKVFYGQEPPSGESTTTEMWGQLSTTCSNY